MGFMGVDGWEDGATYLMQRRSKAAVIARERQVGWIYGYMRAI